MFKLAGFKAFAAVFIAHAVIMCPALARGAEDPPGNLDINNCKKYYSDQDIAQWSSSFDPKKLDVWPQIDKILNLAKQLPNPDFYNALQLSLNKTWRYDAAADFAQCEPEDVGYYNMGNMTKVACQTEGQGAQKGEVVVNPIRYFAYDPISCRKPKTPDELQTLQQNQKALIVHELLLGITLGNHLAHAVTTDIFGLLMNEPLPSVSVLQNALGSSPFFLAVEQALQSQTGNGACNPATQSAITGQAAANIQQVQAAADQVPPSSSAITDATLLENVPSNTQLWIMNNVAPYHAGEIVFQDGHAYNALGSAGDDGHMYIHPGVYCTFYGPTLSAGHFLPVSHVSSVSQKSVDFDDSPDTNSSMHNGAPWGCDRFGGTGKITIGEMKAAFGSNVVVDE